MGKKDRIGSRTRLVETPREQRRLARHGTHRARDVTARGSCRRCESRIPRWAPVLLHIHLGHAEDVERAIAGLDPVQARLGAGCSRIAERVVDGVDRSGSPDNPTPRTVRRRTKNTQQPRPAWRACCWSASIRVRLGRLRCLSTTGTRSQSRGHRADPRAPGSGVDHKADAWLRRGHVRTSLAAPARKGVAEARRDGRDGDRPRE